MRLIFTALLGLAVGVTLSCCRSPQNPAPSQPQAPSSGATRHLPPTERRLSFQQFFRFRT